MKANEAHVFQHKFTGLQMFVYHKSSVEQAKSELSFIGLNTDDWEFLGMKIATCA